MTFKVKLEQLVIAVIDKASEKNTPLQESIDALKAATAYYAATQKRPKKTDDSEQDEDGFSFGASSEAVDGSSGQRAKIRARRDS